jgi:hypothetical protein
MVASDIILFKGMMGSPGEPKKGYFIIIVYIVAKDFYSQNIPVDV